MSGIINAQLIIIPKNKTTFYYYVDGNNIAP